MKNVIFKINEETVKKRLFYGNILIFFGILLTWMRFYLIGIFFLCAGGWFTWHAVSSRKIPNLPKWMSGLLLCLNILANIAFIVLIIGKVFSRL